MKKGTRFSQLTDKKRDRIEALLDAGNSQKAICRLSLTNRCVMTEVLSRPLPSATMSGPELYALLASGYEPIGVVIGVAAISMGSRGFGRSVRAIFNKGEMTAVSQTSAEARRTALARAEEEGKRLRADLILVSEWSVRDVAERSSNFFHKLATNF